MQVIYSNTFYMQMTQIYVVHSSKMQLVNFNDINVEVQKILVNGWKLINFH